MPTSPNLAITYPVLTDTPDPVRDIKEVVDDLETWWSGRFVGVASNTTVGAIAGADVVVMTLPAITGNGSRRYRLMFSAYSLQGTAGETFDVKLYADGTQIKTTRVQIPGLFGVAVALTATHVPAAGPVVYSVKAQRVSGTNTGQINAAAGAPMELTAEHIA